MLRNLGTRIGLFLGGIALLAIGIPLVMAFFGLDAYVPKLGGYVFLVPLFGFAMVCMAFGKLEGGEGPPAGGNPPPGAAPR